MDQEESREHLEKMKMQLKGKFDLDRCMEEDEGICMHKNRLVMLTDKISDGYYILGAYILKKDKIEYCESGWFKINSLTNIPKPPAEKWGVIIKYKTYSGLGYRMDSSIFNSEGKDGSYTASISRIPVVHKNNILIQAIKNSEARR